MLLATLLGGIGLFLLGMILMTDGLKSAAGNALRVGLSRFTGGRFSAMASGAGLTALVQSSSATTLATIGFVSAGLLTFPQAVGVILGVNLGTTSTGWIVSLLGFKVQIGAVALPLVGVGALLRLLGKGRWASVGTAIAGFGLIFVGIGVLQEGMAGVADRIDLSAVGGTTVGGKLVLVGVGAVMTVVMQSSSAAVATTLAALHAEAITIEQAAALVIGQNVGTTVKAAMVSIGGSVAVKRTAVAHILFNVVTGLAAFLGLGVLLRIIVWGGEFVGETDETVAIAAFHTAFNVLGVLIFLPWVDRFSRVVMRIVPERGPELTSHLDPSVASVPEVGVEAARRAARAIAGVIVGQVVGLLGARGRAAPAELERAENALREVQSFLALVRVGPETGIHYKQHLSTVHAVDHLWRLSRVCRDGSIAESARGSEELRDMLEEIRGVFRDAAEAIRREEGLPVERIERVASETARRRRERRARLLELTAAGGVDPSGALATLEAMRWVDRLIYHLWRAGAHLSDVPSGRGDAPPEVAEAEPDVPEGVGAEAPGGSS